MQKDNECKEVIPTKQLLIEWMVENFDKPMDFSIHTACENCREFPPTVAIIASAGIPFFLCNYCRGQYANLLARKLLVCR